MWLYLIFVTVRSWSWWHSNDEDNGSQNFVDIFRSNYDDDDDDNDDDNDDDDDLVLEKERLFAVEGFKLVNNKTR